MGTAIRKHLRDFIAVTVLVLVGLVASYIIVQQQRLRLPVLEEKPFELRAEFQTAQAVVPGQGQTIRVAGVRIGDVQSVGLEHGVGVVTFAIDREFLPIYRNATVLMRPQTGLKDMFFELDPGTKSAGEADEGYTIPFSNTAPDVNLDQILEALDSDTQAYLRLLLVGAGQGLEGRGKDLGAVLGSLGPINRELNTLNSAVAERRNQLADLIHNFNVLTNELGQHDSDIQQMISASNSALSEIARQDPDVQSAVAELPGTLHTAEGTLHDLDSYAQVLGPTFNSLRPFARNLPEMNASVEELGKEATPVLKNQVRPFVRAARKPLPNLRRAASEYAAASPRLTTIGEKFNKLVNMAAYNPRGQEPVGTPGRDEGYLFWLGWLSHNGNLVFNSADGNGLYRRIYFTAGCSQINNILNPVISSPLSPLITGLGRVSQSISGNPAAPCP